MDHGLFRFILRNSARQQTVILGLTALSLPFYYAVLDFPRQIINKGLAVEIEKFPASFKLWGYEPFSLEHLPLLVALCFAFLLAVAINGGLKYVINLKRARMGELLLRQLRLSLCSQALRFPLSNFRKVSPGELVSMITSEVEALGGFIGDAISVPALQCGLLITAFLFIFTQDITLGFASVALLPIQIIVVPRIQRQVNKLSKRRVREVRRLSRRFSESVSLASHLQISATVPHELNVLNHRLGRILDLRYQIFRKKFFVKFFNNFLAQLTPFFFFLIGGYFVIQDELSVGALVAVVVAYKDVPAPWKELLDYYQDQQDARVRYEQVTSRFRPAGTLPINSFEKEDKEIDVGREVKISGVSVLDNDDLILSDVTLSLTDNEHVMVVGTDHQAGQALAHLLIGLEEPHEGSVLIDGIPIIDVSRSRIARVFAYVDSDPRFFTGTILRNLAYGLPDTSPSGWQDEALDVLNSCGLGKALFDFGLDTRLDLSHDSKLQEMIVNVRAELHQRLEQLDGGRLFRPFRIDEYNEHATVLENLLFGSLDKELVDIDQLIGMRWFRKVLTKFGLDALLEQLGLAAAKTLAASPNRELARAKVPIEIIELFNDRISELQALAAAVGNEGTSSLLKSQRRLLLNLALEMLVDRVELPFSTEQLKTKIIASRKAMQDSMHSSVRRSVVFFDSHAYNPSMTLRDNLLFGRPNADYRNARQRVASVLDDTIEINVLHDNVVTAALDYHIGVAGSNLSREQMQKLGLARAFLNPAKNVIACYATSAISAKSEHAIVEALTASASGRGLMWITDRADLAQYFDRTLVFADGSLKEYGDVNEL